MVQGSDEAAERPDTATVDAVAEEVPAGTIEEFLPASTDLIVHDARDDDELAWVMDRHDVEQILMEVQHRALKVWVYDLPGEGGSRRRELSYKGVRDIVALMNRTGRIKIGVLPETLKLERFREDIGNGGPEPFARATIFAKDDVTGQMMPGVSTEPLYLKLTDSKAAKKRRDGKDIPADNRVFDPFAETKATNKAARNALRTFIPEELAQTVIAMFTGESQRVQRIQTATEAKLAELPPPLTDDRAVEQVAQARALYDEIRDLGDGQGRVDFTPGRFHAYLTQSQHSHDRLDEFLAFLGEERERLAGKYAGASA